MNQLYLDSRGLLWICTDAGVSLFDGQRLVNYTRADGLPHGHVNAVRETRDGEYWLATDGGISLFDARPTQKRFTNYSPQGPPEASYVNAIAQDHDGSLLLGTNSGLYRFRRQSIPMFERISYGSSADPPSATKINSITHDIAGALWLATEYGLYQRRADSRWVHYGAEAGLPDLFVFSFATDDSRRVWAGFRGGLGRLVENPPPGGPAVELVHTVRDGLSGRDTQAILFMPGGKRWVGTENGLVEWLTGPRGNSVFRDVAKQEGFAADVVLSLAGDSAGNIWIGTRRSGLTQAGPSQFESFGELEGLQPGGDQALLESRSGVCVFQIGARRTKLYCHSLGRFTAMPSNTPPDLRASIPHWLQMALEDREGQWWFSTPAGLLRYPHPGARHNLRLLADHQVDRFFEDSARDIWISAWPAHRQPSRLIRWERSTNRVHDESVRLPLEARQPGISAFVQDHGGRLWIGLQRPGGILRLKDGRFEKVEAGKSGHINMLFVDSRGHLWIATAESGLLVIADPGSSLPHLRQYTRQQGLAADDVWAVTEDEHGHIYAGTSHGVDRLDPRTGHVVGYSPGDGLVSGDIRSGLRDRNGQLWFASANGVSRMSKVSVRKAPAAPVRITGVRLSGMPLPVSEFGETPLGPLEFEPHSKSLEVSFAAISHGVAPLQYQFRLVSQNSFENDVPWQATGTNTTVHLAGLSAGGYKLEVRAMNRDRSPGVPALFSFRILEPVWQRWWFKCLAGLALATFLYWVHTTRLEKRVALERLRTRIAADLHDDIGSSLSRVSVIGEALKARVRGDPEVQSMLNDVSTSTRMLIADMVDIVWSLDPGRDQIGDLENRLRAFGSDLLERRGIEWSVSTTAGVDKTNIPPDVRRQLYLVFKEGIHNVAKHSTARKATLKLMVDNGYISGELTDDGCGMEGRHSRGHGIGTMRSRVEQLRGTFEITETMPAGTSIRVRVPLGKKRILMRWHSSGRRVKK